MNLSKAKQLTFAVATENDENEVCLTEESDEDTVVHKVVDQKQVYVQPRLNTQASSKRYLETVDISELNNSNILDEKVLKNSTVLSSQATSVNGLIAKCKKVKCSKRRKAHAAAKQKNQTFQMKLRSD